MIDELIGVDSDSHKFLAIKNHNIDMFDITALGYELALAKANRFVRTHGETYRDTIPVTTDLIVKAHLDHELCTVSADIVICDKVISMDDAKFKDVLWDAVNLYMNEYDVRIPLNVMPTKHQINTLIRKCSYELGYTPSELK